MGGIKKRLSALLAGVLTAAALAVPAGAADWPQELEQGKTRAVELGDGISFVLQEDGSLWGWGGGINFDLLGTAGRYESMEMSAFGPVYDQQTPLKLLTGTAQVRTGSPYACPFTVVVKEDGSLWYSGQDTNAFRKLADGVVSACGWERGGEFDASAWYEDIYAVKTDGSLWRYPLLVTVTGDYETGWVYHRDWQSPEKMMDGVAELSAGYQHCLIRKTDGSVWAFGDTSRGQLGNGVSSLDGSEDPERSWTDSPVKVMDGAAEVLASWDFSAAIKTDGSLWVWGDTFGDSLADSVRSRPYKLMDGVAGIHRNESYCTIVKTDGSVWVWGEPLESFLQEMGLGSCGQTPVKTGITGAKQAQGQYQGDRYGIYYVKTGGSLWFWGTESGKGTVAAIHEQLTGKSAAAPAFSDVAPGAYYAQPVAWAVERGVTTGTTTTTFSPYNTCTTAQILTFLWRAMGSPAPTGTAPFTDVPAGAYYAQPAAWAYEQGLVSGSVFGGSVPATREATVTYLWKLAGQPEPQGDNPFTDVSGNARAVVWAMEQGITAGTTDTTFSPDTTCTRGQIVTFLYRDLAA